MLIPFDPLFGRLADLASAAARTATQALPADVYVRDGKLHCLLDLPGADPDDLEVTVDGRRLTVKAERRYAPDPTDRVVTAERPWGRFSRQLQLPAGADVDQLDVSFDGGVLTVTVPIADAEPRTIPVRTSQALPEQPGTPDREPAASGTSAG